MKNTPSSQPTADRSVLYAIHEQGKDADLSFLRSEEANVEQERLYIEAVKREGNAKRRELADQIKRWNAAQDLDPAKAVEREKTRSLLLQLQEEMEPRGADAVETVTEFGMARASDATTTVLKGINKVAGDVAGMGNKDIPLSDKIVTGAKYVIGAIGLTALVRYLNQKWHDTTGKGWISHTFKWLGAIGLGMVGANVIANATDRTTGPELAKSVTKATAEATASGGKATAEATAISGEKASETGPKPEKADFANDADGTEYLSRFAGNRTMDVALGDGTTFRILDPVDEKAGTLQAAVEVDGQRYLVNFDWAGTRFEGGFMNSVAGVLPVKKGELLRTVANFVGVRKKGGAIEIADVSGALLSLSVPIADIKNAVNAVKADGKRSANVVTTVNISSGGATFPVRATLTKA